MLSRGDLNSGPHDCTADISPAKLSSKSVCIHRMPLWDPTVAEHWAIALSSKHAGCICVPVFIGTSILLPANFPTLEACFVHLLFIFRSPQKNVSLKIPLLVLGCGTVVESLASLFEPINWEVQVYP